MDFTDKAVLELQTGETVAWAVECRRRQMTIVGEEGKGGGNTKVGAEKERSSLS